LAQFDRAEAVFKAEDQADVDLERQFEKNAEQFNPDLIGATQRTKTLKGK